MFVKLLETQVTAGDLPGSIRRINRGTVLEVSKEEADTLYQKSIAVPLTEREVQIHKYKMGLDAKDAKKAAASAIDQKEPEAPAQKKAKKKK